MSLALHVTDTHPTRMGSLEITHLGHASLLLTVGDRHFYVDPYARFADYATLPDADAILITHGHHDHLDPKAIAAVRTEETRILCPASCVERIEQSTALRNGESIHLHGVGVQAIPAYSVAKGRSGKGLLHKPGDGNSYILEVGGVRVLIAGDTHSTPELKAQQDIDIAFLPLRTPFTLSAAELSEVTLEIKPKVLYPYHLDPTLLPELLERLAGVEGIDLRIRPRSGLSSDLPQSEPPG